MKTQLLALIGSLLLLFSSIGFATQGGEEDDCDGVSDYPEEVTRSAL